MEYSWCVRKGGSWGTWKVIGCSWMPWICPLAVEPQTVPRRERLVSSPSSPVSASSFHHHRPGSYHLHSLRVLPQSHSNLSCSPFFLSGFWGMQTRFGAFSEAWLIVRHRILLPFSPVLNTKEVFLDPLELLFFPDHEFLNRNSCLQIFNPRECNGGHICPKLWNVEASSHMLFH